MYKRRYRGGYAPVDIGSKMSFRRCIIYDSTFISHTIVVSYKIPPSLLFITSFFFFFFFSHPRTHFNDYLRDKRAFSNWHRISFVRFINLAPVAINLSVRLISIFVYVYPWKIFARISILAQNISRFPGKESRRRGSFLQLRSTPRLSL